MSNPITITVSNKDAGNQYILIFQKPTNVSEMYDTLFPTAWKVLPLSNSSNANITYPVELQIMVKESATSYDAKNRGTIQETEVGQLWEFFVEKDFPMLKKAVSAKPVDGLMGCVNKAPQKIDVGLAKSGKTLVVKRKVSQDDQANFKLTDKLYFAYVTDIEEGELIKSDISASKTYELNLTNLKSVEIELSVEDENTGKKKWIELNRKSAS